MAYDAEPVGVLATLVDRIHTWSNEPTIQAKYPASKLYPIIRSHYGEVFSELMRMSDNQYWVRFDVSVVDGDTHVLLPSNVGTIERIVERDSVTGLPRTEFYNRGRRHVAGPGFQHEGNFLRWSPTWVGGAKTLTIEYQPSGETHVGYGTAATASSSQSALVLSTSPTEGYFDRRPGAYLGLWLRVLGAGTTLTENPSGYSFFPIQERVIRAYDENAAAGPQVTVEPQFDFDLSSAAHNASSGFTNLRYEIVPSGLAKLTDVIAWRTVMTLHSVSGNSKLRNLAQQEYANKYRDLKMAVANVNNITGNRFEHDARPDLTDFWALL